MPTGHPRLDLGKAQVQLHRIDTIGSEDDIASCVTPLRHDTIDRQGMLSVLERLCLAGDRRVGVETLAALKRVKFGEVIGINIERHTLQPRTELKSSCHSPKEQGGIRIDSSRFRCKAAGIAHARLKEPHLPFPVRIVSEVVDALPLRARLAVHHAVPHDGRSLRPFVRLEAMLLHEGSDCVAWQAGFRRNLRIAHPFGMACQDAFALFVRYENLPRLLLELSVVFRQARVDRAEADAQAGRDSRHGHAGIVQRKNLFLHPSGDSDKPNPPFST
jgi:hypothetical protein